MEIVKLSAGLGAEIRGVDISQPIDDPTFAEIEQAWRDHLIPVSYTHLTLPTIYSV